MNTALLSDVIKRQDELAALIAQLQQQATATQLINLSAFEIELQPGERYAGAVLAADGHIEHHLVLLPAKPDGRLDWDEAKEWAEDAGGSLPTRQEHALLFANLKAEFEPAWHWSSEEYEDDASCAWSCDFNDGYQFYDPKSAELCARAVRRLIP